MYHLPYELYQKFKNRSKSWSAQKKNEINREYNRTRPKSKKVWGLLESAQDGYGSLVGGLSTPGSVSYWLIADGSYKKVEGREVGAWAYVIIGNQLLLANQESEKPKYNSTGVEFLGLANGLMRLMDYPLFDKQRDVVYVVSDAFSSIEDPESPLISTLKKVGAKNLVGVSHHKRDRIRRPTTFLDYAHQYCHLVSSGYHNDNRDASMRTLLLDRIARSSNKAI